MRQTANATTISDHQKRIIARLKAGCTIRAETDIATVGLYTPSGQLVMRGVDYLTVKRLSDKSILIFDSGLCQWVLENTPNEAEDAE